VPVEMSIHQVARWCGGQHVGLVIGRSRVQLPAMALSDNDLGQVVHTNVPLFTKQQKLVPCEGIHADTPFVAAMP